MGMFFYLSEAKSRVMIVPWKILQEEKVCRRQKG